MFHLLATVVHLPSGKTICGYITRDAVSRRVVNDLPEQITADFYDPDLESGVLTLYTQDTELMFRIGVAWNSAGQQVVYVPRSVIRDSVLTMQIVDLGGE